MSYANEITKRTDFSTLAEKVRLVFGLLMMISGLYFGLFSTGAGEGLGFLSFLTSPFIMVNGK
ncbi:MAG TPA: hypothetical protein VNB22_06345 [Pyrinomonadaceae bacterium]|jgi:hypothetical protein|nr:hypothetical protein [Pyrinomonadaceae bacterium]